MDRSLPDGVVTFVFTDIEGSTRLLRHLGEGYAAVLDRHREILRDAWDEYDGHEVDSSGDAFFVAFDSAAQALGACAGAQRAMDQEPWPDGASVRVRMGVHTGLAAPRDGRYVAFAVHQGARIGATAHGGQVVVSEQGVPNPTDPLSPGVGLRSLGRFRVRDFDRPVELHQLTGPGLRGDFPAVRAAPATSHHLPVPATRLIGREHDLTRLTDALDAARLVTVVGTGGVGKTRLVTELGIRHEDRWPDGVWLVDCGRLEEPALLPTAIATAVGVGTKADRPLWQEVHDRLDGKRALIILDGCERHLHAAREAADELNRGRTIQVLATSTEPLRSAAETLHRLAPLPGGDAKSPAVELFLERARAVDPEGADATDTVIEVCRRLDGLPLAMEIAAARSGVLQPHEILEGLDRRFQLLRARDSGRPARQHTMAALLDWSFRLLSPDEARLLPRLSLFAAGFDLDAATAAAGTDLDPDDVPELVWALVDKSLLSTDREGGSTRYRALETVRSYARERLDEAGETQAVGQGLAEFYARKLAPDQGTGLDWVHAVSADLDNLRAVVHVSGSQLLAVSIARHHDVVQTYRAGIDEVTALANELTTPTPARVGLLTALGDLYVRVGDVDEAARYAEAAARVRALSGPPEWDEVGVEKLLGDIAIRQDSTARTVALAQAALAGDLSVRGRARMFNMLGIALATAGRDDEAAEAFAEELAAAQETADDVLLAHAHGNSAEIAHRRGRLDEAARHQRLGLDLAVALGQTGMVALALLGTAQIGVGATQDWPGAVRLVAKAGDLERLTQMDLYPTDRNALRSFQAEARDVLGSQEFARHEADGRAMIVDDALSLARKVLAGTDAGR